MGADPKRTQHEHLLDAVHGTFVPSRLLLRLPEIVQTYGFDGGTADAEAQATLVHEQFHFFQTIFTGYGQIAWLTHRQITAFVLGEWEELTSTHSTKRLPLAHLASRDARTRRAVQGIERLLDELFAINNGRFRCEGENTRVRDLGCKGLDYPWHVTPRIEVAGRPYLLQGKDILESHAQFTESSYLAKAHGVPFESGFDHRNVSMTYTAPWDWFNDTCSGHSNDFPFVCDLALQISWNKLEAPKSEAEWRASHPAWRFVALTRALARLQCWAGDPVDAATWYDGYATTLLESCNYKPIRGVLEERRAVFAGKKLSALDSLMCAAIEFRLRKVWCAANPFVDVRLWNEMSSAFRMPVIQAAGELGSTHVDEEVIRDVFYELQYQALALQVAGDLSPQQRIDRHLECAFAKFRIEKGCEFQRNGSCSGRFLPSSGLPHPAKAGCSFGVLLEQMMKLDVRKLELKDVAESDM